MRYLIRDKSRGYGVSDQRYPTRAEAEANMWKLSGAGGELVVEEDTSSIEWREAVSILDDVVNEYRSLSVGFGMPTAEAVTEALAVMKRGY